jgi:hypothetical protein
MIVRRIGAVAVVALGLALGAIGGRAAGLHLGCEIILLDVAGTFGKVPVALHAGSDALLVMLADQGLPPGDVAEIEASFHQAIVDATEGLSAVPPLLPFPLLGGGVEIPLPFVVVDAVRFSGGFLNTALVRGIVDAAGVELPDPLFDQEIDLGDETGRFTVDLGVAAWSVSLSAVKRLDLFLAALDLCAGVGYVTGAVSVDIVREAPDEWIGGIDSALAELHLHDVRWSALSMQFGGRLELGPPFLRLYVEARFVQPIVEWVGWWDLRVGSLAGSVGVVIRF